VFVREVKGRKVKKKSPAKRAAEARAKPRPPTTRKKPARSKATRTKSPRAPASLDLSAFPPEAVAQLERWLCLACVLDVFTRHMGLTRAAVNRELARYEPSAGEVTASSLARPYFSTPSPEGGCPYCGSPKKWHARLPVVRIEGGKATDALRRKLVRGLPPRQFAVLEQKATGQRAFFDWLEGVSAGLDLDDPRALWEISRHYLGRTQPTVDWGAQLAQVHAIRRSRRLETGWEIDDGRLFLAPLLFDELLLVQYLVSRSHKASGMTLEGRLTLLELFVRLRNSGYLHAVGVSATNPSDAFEQLLDHVSGGQTTVKFHCIVDRRDFLERVKAVQQLAPPRPKR
jgi:hypothetical protein